MNTRVAQAEGILPGLGSLPPDGQICPRGKTVHEYQPLGKVTPRVKVTLVFTSPIGDAGSVPTGLCVTTQGIPLHACAISMPCGVSSAMAETSSMSVSSTRKGNCTHLEIMALFEGILNKVVLFGALSAVITDKLKAEAYCFNRPFTCRLGC